MDLIAYSYSDLYLLMPMATSSDDTSPAIPDDDSGITLRDVLIHIQHHTDRIDKKIDGVAQDLKDFHEEFREFAKGVDDYA